MIFVFSLISNNKMSRSPPLNITISNFPHRFFKPFNVICGLSYKVPFSRHYVKVKNILNKFSLNNSINDKYVLCPIYGKKQDEKLVPTDIQIGVTGKAKVTEPIKMSVNRELGEELGLIVPYNNLEEHIHGDINNPSLFVISVKNMICPNNDIENNVTRWWGPDDHYRKIGICVIGTKDEVMKVLSSESFGYRYLNAEKDIIGVISIPISLALQQTGTKI
jgi:hypothetical protein